MDTSPVYILQCEKAEEIQKHVLMFGDYFWWCNSLCLVTGESKGESLNSIWLPRQDQLQEMAWSHVAGTYNLLPTKLFAFSDYWEENGIPIEFTSMEQLWLAFCQKEKFNKIWNGTNWEVDNG